MFLMTIVKKNTFSTLLVGLSLTFLMSGKAEATTFDGRDYTQVKNLEIPEEGLIVHLKSFGKVKVFQKTFKNEGTRYYIIFSHNEDALVTISWLEFKALHSIY